LRRPFACHVTHVEVQVRADGCHAPEHAAEFVSDLYPPIVGHLATIVAVDLPDLVGDLAGLSGKAEGRVEDADVIWINGGQDSNGLVVVERANHRVSSNGGTIAGRRDKVTTGSRSPSRTSSSGCCQRTQARQEPLRIGQFTRTGVGRTCRAVGHPSP